MRGSVCRWYLIVVGLALVDAPRVAAQSELATVQGLVTGENREPLAGAIVTARDLKAGTVRSARTGTSGFYYIGGLQASNYVLQATAIGHRPQVDTMHISVATTPRLDFQLVTSATQLEQIQISAAAPVSDLRDPTVASQISTDQIVHLPQIDRNFLDLARLVPGVQQPIPPNDQKTFGAGAATLDQVNVYIDGASYKNNVLNGGVNGQTTNRGNPFPENAVQEFRVITNNFKPEYQYATSAIVEAKTQSGGNEWHGNIFGYGEAPWMIRRDFQSTINGSPPPDFRRLQDGVSLGGPIIKDKLHIFGSYEGNYQNFATRVIPGTPASATGQALDAQQFASTQIQQLRQSLFFGAPVGADGSPTPSAGHTRMAETISLTSTANGRATTRATRRPRTSGRRSKRTASCGSRGTSSSAVS